MLILGEHGADALRLYLINSPVVRAETLCFKDAGVKAIVKDVFLPWYASVIDEIKCALTSTQECLYHGRL